MQQLQPHQRMQQLQFLQLMRRLQLHYHRTVQSHHRASVISTLQTGLQMAALPADQLHLLILLRLLLFQVLCKTETKMVSHLHSPLLLQVGHLAPSCINIFFIASSSRPPKSKGELTLTHRFKGHTNTVHALVHNGETVISSGRDGTIIVWDKDRKVRMCFY